MKISQKVFLEETVNEHTFTMVLPHGPTWKDAVIAAANLLSAVNKLAEKAAEDIKKEEETMTEEVVVEVEEEKDGDAIN